MLKIRIAAIAAGLLLMFSAVPADAATDPGGGGGSTTGCGGNGVAGFLGFKSWDACLDHDSNGVPQIKSLDDIWKIAIILVEFIIKLAGYLAAGFIIWGGIKYVKSQGEPGETAQARQIINNALFGLIICLVSVAIVQYIAGIF